MGVKYVTAGESHGRSLVAILEGIPAGVVVSTAEIRNELAKRRGGVGRGERQNFEQDDVTIISGVLQGQTIASPIAIEIKNSEWEKWQKIMSPDFNNCHDLPAPNMPAGEKLDKLQCPRPGHADLEGIRKYGFTSARPVLERASARETAARVAVGAVAKAFLRQVAKIEVVAKVVQFGTLIRQSENGIEQDDAEFDRLATQVAEQAVANRETVGGIVVVTVHNVPSGLGSYIAASERLDAKLAGALMSIPAVKAVAIGDGFDIASTLGSVAHDEIVANNDGHNTKFLRKTNHAGGIEGGMSNGEDIVLSIAIKPIPSVPGGLETINLSTGEIARAHSQRSDCSAVYPARIVAEAMVALTLSDAVTIRYGADKLVHLNDVLQ